jgi:drug/metabolite transporter (DMT)-like permease
LSSPAYTSTTRPLDALAAGIVVVLCLSWGFNQVATKLAIHDIPPLTQAAVRSAVAALLISAWCRLRGIALLKRDGTMWFGLTAGVLFAVEFILIFQVFSIPLLRAPPCSYIVRRFLWWLARGLSCRRIASGPPSGSALAYP